MARLSALALSRSLARLIASNKFRPVDWLHRENLYRARLHCLHALSDAPIAGKKYDGSLNFVMHQCLLEVQSPHR